MHHLTNDFFHYVISNQGNIIASLVFCVLGVILPLLFTRNNGSIKEDTKIVVNRKIIVNEYVVRNQVISETSNNSSNITISVMFLLLILAVILYEKYHFQILLYTLFGWMFCSTSVITLTIRLSRQGNLSLKAKKWIILLMVMLCGELLNLNYMYNQVVTINHIGLNTFQRVEYEVVGCLFGITIMLLILLVSVYLWTMHSRINKLTLFLIRRTLFLNNSFASFLFISVFLLVVSLLFSSDTASHWILQHRQQLN